MKASMTRGSCYVFESTEHAYVFSKWALANVDGSGEWLEILRPFQK
jgi:hypothetical protein